MLYGYSALVIGRLQRVQNYAAHCDTVEPMHATTAVARVITLGASAGAARLRPNSIRSNLLKTCLEPGFRQVRGQVRGLVSGLVRGLVCGLVRGLVENLVLSRF